MLCTNGLHQLNPGSAWRAPNGARCHECHLAMQARYEKSTKGKRRKQRYERSEKGKATHHRYNMTPRGRAVQRVRQRSRRINPNLHFDMTDPIDRELARRIREGGLRYDAGLIEDMALAPDAWPQNHLPLEVRDPRRAAEQPAHSRRATRKTERPKTEPEETHFADRFGGDEQTAMRWLLGHDG